MADIDQILAGGAGASSRADFSGLADIPEAYWKGRDRRYTQEGRDLFKGGVPTNPDGSINYGAMRDALFQHGDVGQGTALDNLDIERQKLKFGQQQSQSIRAFESGQPQQPAIVSPPSSNRSAATPVAPPLNRGGVQSQSTVDPSNGPGGMSIYQILDAQGIPNDQLASAGASIARQLGVSDPTQPIDTNDPRIRNVLVPAIQQLKRAGVGNIIPEGQPSPPDQVIGQARPQVMGPAGAVQPNAQGVYPANAVMMPQSPQPPVMAQGGPPPAPAPAPVVSQGQPGPVTNAVTGTTAPATPSRTDQAIAFYAGIMSNPISPKQNVDLAKTRLESLQKSTELTPDQKNYVQAVTQGFRGTMQDFQAKAEADKAAAKAVAEGNVKEQNAFIDSGRAAGQRLTTLNTVSNIIANDKSMTLGFGADTALKVKKALQQIGFDVGDLSGAQSIEKLNGLLAAEATKTISPRPSQFEFKTFLANNPGLNMDRAGNMRVISIFSQLAKRDLDLGKLARQNRGDWQNWDNVVETYDKQNPIVDPVTKQSISTNSVIAPAPTKTQPPPGSAAAASGPDPAAIAEARRRGLIK